MLFSLTLHAYVLGMVDTESQTTLVQVLVLANKGIYEKPLKTKKQKIFQEQVLDRWGRHLN